LSKLARIPPDALDAIRKMSLFGCYTPARYGGLGLDLPRALELGHALAQLPQPALIADRRGVVASTGQPLQAGLDFEARAGRAVMRDLDVIERLTEYRERHA
jgi:alkylation response protein AidB-like acyl-CoA dehydrogenase